MYWKKNIIKLLVAVGIVIVAFSVRKAEDNPLVQIYESTVGSTLGRLIGSHKNQRCGAVKWDSYVIVSDRVVFPDGVRPAALHIVNDKIADIGPENTFNLTHVLNFKHAVISPGVIDIHVHYNEPGREDWEGFTSGTESSLLGGATTTIEMPLNSDPTITDLPQLLAKIKIAKKKAFSNLGFWAGIVPQNARNHELLQKLLDNGALGFKSFMSPSGVYDFDNVSVEDIKAAIPFLKKRGVPLYVHAELVSEIEPKPELDPREFATFLRTRPASFERRAVRALIDVLEGDRATPYQPGFLVHVAHLGDAESLAAIQAAKASGLPLSVETCAHYLLFNSEDIPDGRTEFKCMPPIRDKENRDRLREAVAAGQIDVISSDHSPAPINTKFQKEGDFLKAWGGIVGNQYLLPATWTSLKELVSANDQTGLPLLAKLMSVNPARIAGLSASKGKIEEGFDADLVIWEPERLANTSMHQNYNRNKLTPYANLDLPGRILATVVSGDIVSLYGRPNPTPCGSVILRRDDKQ